MAKMSMVAQSVNDPILRFNCGLWNADPEERVKVLAESGQLPLAYMLAKSHGLKDFEKTLEESLRSMDGVDPDEIIAEAETYSSKSAALLPLKPLLAGENERANSSNWPMTNMRAK